MRFRGLVVRYEVCVKSLLLSLFKGAPVFNWRATFGYSPIIPAFVICAFVNFYDHVSLYAQAHSRLY